VGYIPSTSFPWQGRDGIGRLVVVVRDDVTGTIEIGVVDFFGIVDGITI